MAGPNGTAPGHRWSLPRGKVLRRALRTDATQEYLLYVPHSATLASPVMVSVHGISRNAFEQAAVFSALCERRGAIMLAPMFMVDQHQDYQRLGRKGRGIRVDLLLHRFLSEVGLLTGADVSRIYLFGFSGGAQFAHRYLMVHPYRVAAAAIAAAGWYTFPDNSERYPFGIRPHRALEGVGFDPEQFLQVPIEVIVGEKDTDDANLRRTDRVDAQQGRNRLERARNWVRAMREAAEAHGLEPVTRLAEVPGIEHSFSTFCERGDLVKRVEHALFEFQPAADQLAVIGNGAATNGRARMNSHDETGD